MHRRPGPPDGQRLRLPDAGDGQRRDARPVRGWASARSSPPARTASTRSATSTASWAGTTRSSTTRRTSRELVSSGRLATHPDGCRRHRDRRPRPGTRDLPRLVLPGPLQRRGRRAARRAGRRRASSVTEMEKSRQADVLLRRRRRADVDGGEPRHADQRRADPPGPRDRRRRRSPRPARSAWRC